MSLMKLYLSLKESIETVLYSSAEPLESLAELFEEKAKSVNIKLKQLVGQVKPYLI